MTVLYILTVLNLALTAVLRAWAAYKEREKKGTKLTETEEAELSEEIAANLEKAWNEGVSNIMSYDLDKAKGAARYDE